MSKKGCCRECKYADWDADGCTCMIDGLIVCNASDYTCDQYRPAKPLTNADRIRQMTDEDLSVFLGGIADNCSYNTCDNCPMYGACVDVPLSRDKWLKQEASEEIDKQPTIEPEVRHGRWETWGYVFHGIEWKRCSCCGKCADVSYYGLLDGEIRMSTPAICGCCGARMDATDTNVGGKGGTDNG